MSRATSAMKTANGFGDTGKTTLWGDMIRIRTARLAPNWSPRRFAIPISSAEILERIRIAVASARAGNVIGGGDWTSDQLIPDLMRAFLAGKPCLIRNPSAIRPWQFVLEPLRGYLMLAERLAEDADRFASAWNFGPAEADAKPVSWIADELVRSWGNGASWSQDGGIHPREAHYLKLDVSKARACLDWHPCLPLNHGPRLDRRVVPCVPGRGRSSTSHPNANRAV